MEMFLTPAVADLQPPPASVEVKQGRENMSVSEREEPGSEIVLLPVTVDRCISCAVSGVSPISVGTGSFMPFVCATLDACVRSVSEGTSDSTRTVTLHVRVYLWVICLGQKHTISLCGRRMNFPIHPLTQVILHH